MSMATKDSNDAAATDALQAVFTSHMYSDLIVICGPDKYYLHRPIICPRSAFFEKACATGSKETGSQTITIHEDDQYTFNRMLIYLYSRDYPDGAVPQEQRPSSADIPPAEPYLQALTSATSTTPKTPPTDDKVINNVRLYVMAHKYELPNLKEIAEKRFRSLTEVENLSTRIVPVIITVFDGTPTEDQGLRKIITEFCIHNVDSLMADPEFSATMKKYADLSFDVLAKSHEIDKQALERLAAEKATINEELTAAKASLSQAHDLENSLLHQKKAAAKNQKRATRQRNSVIKQRDDLLNNLAEANTRAAMASAENTQLKEDRDAARAQGWDLLTSLNMFLETAGHCDRCRHCRRSFGSYLQRFDNNDQLGLQLRCKNCRCKHDIGAGLGNAVRRA